MSDHVPSRALPCRVEVIAPGAGRDTLRAAVRSGFSEFGEVKLDRSGHAWEVCLPRGAAEEMLAKHGAWHLYQRIQHAAGRVAQEVKPSGGQVRLVRLADDTVQDEVWTPPGG